MMKKIFFVTFLIILVSMVLSACGATDPNITGGDVGKNDPRKIKYALGEIIEKQRAADQKIQNAMKDTGHTLDDPLVLVNPYDIAPMSAIIVFQTDNETSIEMNINDKYVTSVEKSREHAIPVYGLYDDHTNKVSLTTDDGKSTTIEIALDKYEGERLNLIKTYEEDSDSFYLVSPDYENTSIWDKDGRLLWFLATGDNEGAVVFLDNGHFLISDPYQGTGGIRINYSGFLEMDYTGKIYKQWIGEYGYHHEIKLINDGDEILLSGNDETSPYRQAIVYVINSRTGEVKQTLDFYRLLHDIAPEWADALCSEGKLNLVLNGFDYDEGTGDVITSLRAIGMVMRVNLDTGEIKWIFSDPKKLPKEFDSYLLTPLDDTRYALSQHCPVFLEDGMFAYHNNDVDILNDGDSLKDYEGRYSSTEILKVNEDDMTVETVWTYDDDKKVLSKMSGSIEFIEDGHKLISYGSALRPEAWDNIDNAQIMDSNYITGLMEELDENDNVVWKASLGSVMHKVYKNKFYEDATSNFNPLAYEKIDGQKDHLGDIAESEEVTEAINTTEQFDGNLDVFINRLIVDTEHDISDEIKVLFISDDEGAFIYTYKKKGEDLPIVNSGRYGTQMTIPNGQYSAYVNINGKYYDTNTDMIFE